MTRKQENQYQSWDKFQSSDHQLPCSSEMYMEKERRQCTGSAETLTHEEFREK